MTNGGSAFPIPEVGEHKSHSVAVSNPGMSLRDYFAAAALQGMLAGHASGSHDSEYALEAYQYADEMLKARL